jgi:hypothetical protein
MQITRALGDQGNALHVAYIAKGIDASVRSRPSPARCRTVTAPTPRPGVAICCSRFIGTGSLAGDWLCSLMGHWAVRIFAAVS